MPSIMVFGVLDSKQDVADSMRCPWEEGLLYSHAQATQVQSVRDFQFWDINSRCVVIFQGTKNGKDMEDDDAQFLDKHLL
jgi:hypothetical protein